MTARNEKRSELPPGVLELLLLKGLARGSAHGYGLARWVEGRSEGALLVEEGSLYPALHRLQRKGLVCSDWGRTESGRRARFYTLEDAGHQELKARSKRYVRQSNAVQLVLRARLSGGSA